MGNSSLSCAWWVIYICNSTWRRVGDSALAIYMSKESLKLSLKCCLKKKSSLYFFYACLGTFLVKDFAPWLARLVERVLVCVRTKGSPITGPFCLKCPSIFVWLGQFDMFLCFQSNLSLKMEGGILAICAKDAPSSKVIIFIFMTW